MNRSPEHPCPSCGAFARIFKNGQSQCAYCGTALAPLPFTHPGGTYPHNSPLRIGMTATISGKKFVAVGRLLFEQYAEGEFYHWEEWVLLSQDGFARYLEFDEGKWTLTEAWPGGPDELPDNLSEGALVKRQRPARDGDGIAASARSPESRARFPGPSPWEARSLSWI